MLTWPQNAGSPFPRGNFSDGDVTQPHYRGTPSVVLYSPQFLTSCSSLIIETLRLRFGYLTSNVKPRFAFCGFTLAVCPYLGLKIRRLIHW